jgi:hypothetical protein
MSRDEEVAQRAGSLGALSRLTKAEFQAFLRHFAQFFVTGMLDRTLAGQPRTSRRYCTNNTCPVPTLADTRRFMLTYVKQPPIHEVPGPLLGMSHAHTNTWIHWRHPVLDQAVADPARLPARTAAAFTTMFETPGTDGRATASPVWYGSSERPIRRLTDSEDPQEHDHGTQKGHTLKNLMAINETCHSCGS